MQQLHVVDPDRVVTTALRTAAAAAKATGDEAKAASYTRLANALEPGEPTVAAPVEPGVAAAAIPDTADELLGRSSDSEPVAEPEIGTLGTAGVTLTDVGRLDDVK